MSPAHLLIAAILLTLILVGIIYAARAPYGYEDDDGWHADPEPYLSKEVRHALRGPTHDHPNRDSRR